MSCCWYEQFITDLIIINFITTLYTQSSRLHTLLTSSPPIPANFSSTFSSFLSSTVLTTTPVVTKCNSLI